MDSGTGDFRLCFIAGKDLNSHGPASSGLWSEPEECDRTLRLAC
jgi:hypothetical protein